MKKNFLQKSLTKIRHGLLTKWVFDQLTMVGIEIVPYYWMREGILSELPKGTREKNFEEFTFRELTEDDMKKIAMKKGDRVLSEDYLRRKINTPGVKCFALTHSGRIACFTWFNLKECTSKLRPTQLKNNEAYLFDMYTMKEFRGRNLAPYIRFKSMEMLRKMGKDTFYSISETYNIPSIKFKQKLGAEFLELHLRIKLFNRFQRHWLLRKYS